MKVVVLMAGLGTRFKHASKDNLNYLVPKPFIQVNGKPMVYWATSSLPFIQHNDDVPVNTEFKIKDSDIIFVLLKKDSEYLSQIHNWYGKKTRNILLEELTRGAAESALMTKNFVASDDSILILDSDNFYDGSNFYSAIRTINQTVDCLISVFQPNDNDPKWSYALHLDGIVTEINEKDPELMSRGADAIIGSFYFSSAGDFFNEVEEMIRENDLSGPAGKQEFYMSQVCKRYLKKGKAVRAVRTESMWGLGTPQDLEFFLENHK